jgi:hypothetical protein
VRVAVAVAVAGLVAATAGVAFGGAPPVLEYPAGGNPGAPTPDEVRFATSGNHSELVESIPITSAPKAAPAVAMSVALPPLELNDQLRVEAEVQPSTTCVVAGSRCIGTRYRINPFIRARLVLADGPEATASSIELAPGHVVHCTQRRPNRNHHCPLVFRSVARDITNPLDLPCLLDACYVNLLVSADHPKAKTGNKIVLGGDRPSGKVAQDKGRVSAIIVHDAAPEPTAAIDGGIRARGLRLHPRPGASRKRVVHSIEVPDLHHKEILEASATFRAAIPSGRKGSGGQRRRKRHAFNAYIGSDLILADTPSSTQPTSIAHTAGLRGELAEGNGLNCTQRPSGFRTPCFVEKAGAIRITEDMPAGTSLYLNLVSRAKPLLKIARKKDKVKLRPEGGLSAIRYAQG